MAVRWLIKIGANVSQHAWLLKTRPDQACTA
jgi:hypothetical protein